ncbi:MAG: hypothetical protein ACTSRZ_04435 [Promethearchaeota archaeon]
MPSIAHLILGGFIGVFLYKISNGKFSKHHVFLLFMNNYLGPDVGWALGIGDFTHTLFGYAIFALLLTLFYSYFTRFSVDFKKIILIDNKKIKLGYLASYLLVLAGGVMHIYLDGIMNYNGRFYYFPALNEGDSRISMTIWDLIQLWKDSAIGINTIFSVIGGIIFILGFMHLFVYFVQTKDLKKAKPLIYTILYIVVFMIYFYLFGNYSTAYHADAGAIIYVFSFWILPIALCYFSTEYNPIFERKQMINPIKFVNFISCLYFIVGVLLICTGVFFIFFNGTVADFLQNLEPTIFSSYNAEFKSFSLVSGIILILFGGFDIVLFRANIKNKVIDFKLVFLIAFFSLIAFIGSIIIVGGFTIKLPITDYVYATMGSRISPYMPQEKFIQLIPIAAAILLTLPIANGIMAVGLAFKIKKLYHLSIILNLIVAIAIYPIAIACYLSEDKIKDFYGFRDANSLNTKELKEINE